MIIASWRPTQEYFNDETRRDVWDVYQAIVLFLLRRITDKQEELLPDKLKELMWELRCREEDEEEYWQSRMRAQIKARVEKEKNNA